MQSTKLLTIILVVVFNEQLCRAFPWDWVPVISQIKSLVQYVCGDQAGAKKTQENFIDTVPIISQIKTVIQYAKGDKKGAMKTVQKFAVNSGNVLSTIPGVRLFKGVLQVVSGDKKHGVENIERDISNIFTFVGNGPGVEGFIKGASKRIVIDSVISIANSIYNKNMSPFGISEFFINYRNKTTGEVFDEVADVFGEAGLDILFHKLRTGAPNPKFGMNTKIDVNNPAFLEIARWNTGLEQKIANQLEPIDFKNVNDINGTTNCYFCTVAAFNNSFASNLVQRYKITRKASGVSIIPYTVELFKKIGFSETKVTFEGDAQGLFTFLDNNIEPGHSSSFALAFTRLDGSGHVILLRAWRELSGTLKILTTNFELPVEHRNRFSTKLPPNVKKLYLIQPQAITFITEQQVTNLIDDMNATTLSKLMLPSGKKSCANKRIIGYLPFWSTRRFTVEQSLHLTNVIYAFISMDAEGGLTLPTATIASQRYLDTMIAKQAHLAKGMDLKVSFAIGGWNNIQHFSSVIGDSKKRGNLIESIATMIHIFKFDGVDINWKNPVAGRAKKAVDSDKKNYVKFLNELRHLLGNQYLISIAGAAGQEALEGFDLENIVKVVDWISVMSYDMNGAWESNLGAFVGPNAPLYHGAPLVYSGKVNVNYVLKQYTCNAKDPTKIIMGIPFYGRFWFHTIPGIDPIDYPLRRLAIKDHGKYGGDKSYNELVSTWLSSSNGFDKRWDEKTKTPWAIHPKSNLTLTYDNEKSIKIKVNYAIEHNLGGVMIWTVDQDDDQISLLKTISSNICVHTDNNINYKCNPFKGKRWWTRAEDKNKAGMCGKKAPLYEGFYPLCDPDEPGYSCCSEEGQCGSGPKFCDCKGCINYARNPEKLIAEPIKPPGPV